LGRGIDQTVYFELFHEGAHSFALVILAKVPRCLYLPPF
jgi:hypothetical protein